MTPEQTKAFKSLATKTEVVEKEFLKQPQVACPVVHHFGPGIYMREVKIPAGAFAIGHHQNFEHVNILLSGRVTIRNEDGSFTELKAPLTFIGKPGRKIGFVHEDMVWLNVYATDETDVEKLEAKYLTKSVTFNDAMASSKQVLELSSSIDTQDFELALKEFGLTKEQVREQSENQSDMTKLYGSYMVKTADSRIEGKGLFATGDFEPGDLIAPARRSGKRTIAGRFTNHSRTPNARMVRGIGKDINLIAIKKISGCHGGMDGQEITVNYREAFALTLEIGKVD